MDSFPGSFLEDSADSMFHAYNLSFGIEFAVFFCSNATFLEWVTDNIIALVLITQS